MLGHAVNPSPAAAVPRRVLPPPWRGFSLVEFMVGTALGAWLLLGAIQLIGQHGASYRAQVRELRLNQELRAAADVMASDLKRAGHWSGALQAWAPGADMQTQTNPFAAVAVDSTLPSDWIEYSYDRSTPTLPAAFGFRRRATADGVGSLQMKNAGGGWQPLTDPQVVNITRLAIVPVQRVVELWPSCRCRFQVLRAPDCEDTALAERVGRPQQRIRGYEVEIAGVAPGDSTLVRVVRASIRLGNTDAESLGGCPAP